MNSTDSPKNSTNLFTDLKSLVERLPPVAGIKQSWGQQASLTKLKHLLREDSILGSRRVAEANGKSVMKTAHGENYVPPVDDDMIVNDSPQTTYNITQPPPPSKIASSLMPLALGALLATTGIGAIGTAVALPMLIDALKQKPTQPTTQQPPVQNPPVQKPPPATGSSHTYQGRANIRVGEPTITPPPGG